jgi:hypothetical protein
MRVKLKAKPIASAIVFAARGAPEAHLQPKNKQLAFLTYIRVHDRFRLRLKVRRPMSEVLRLTLDRRRISVYGLRCTSNYPSKKTNRVG